MPLSTARVVVGTGGLTPPSERQAGGRLPAPGELALVQAFVNSRWDLDHELQDRFGDPQGLGRWLVEHGLLESGARLGGADLGRARDVREGLRQLLFANNGHAADQEAVARLNAALRHASVSVRLRVRDRPEFVARRGGLDAALAAIALIVAAAQIEGSWSRLKACPGRDCGWVFYDRSRNQSSSWCSMSVCGQREKAREYRKRRTGGHE
jgi:predicted RNA-binding Zn ribbon-like protein